VQQLVMELSNCLEVTACVRMGVGLAWIMMESQRTLGSSSSSSSSSSTLAPASPSHAGCPGVLRLLHCL
jgi:hypothetical protein